MPVVVFESPRLPPREIAVPGGGRLLDVCDAHCAPVPFSCRSASCGSCRIEVLEGASLLLAPAPDELELLDVFGDDPSRCRLACQVRLRAEDGLLRVRPADAE
jgi:ferredoxin